MAETTKANGLSADRRRYWAAAPVAEFAGELENRIEAYYTFLGRGQLELWRRLYRRYFGRDPNGTDRNSATVTDGGEEGETPEVLVNEFRSVLRHMLTLTTGTRPAVVAKSLTPDYHSLAARNISQSLIERDLSEGTLEDRLIETTELGIVLGEGGTYQWWDPDAGKPILDPETRRPLVETTVLEEASNYRDTPHTMTRILREGWIRELSLLPDDIIRDPKAHHWPEEAKWVCVRRNVNRWDLAARYPKHADHILKADVKPNWTQTLRDRDEDDRPEDDVTVFEFYHIPSSALPDGRASVLLDGVVIADGKMPYDDLPVHMVMPAKEKGRPFSYSKGADILGPSQALDAAAITALANHDALGTQKIWLRKGSGAEVRDLGGGVKAVESTEPPVPLKLMESSEASEAQAEYWRGVIERLSGMNSVARGEPQASLKSGTALLFVHSQALQANSDIDRAHIRHCAEVFTSRIRILRKFCKESRLVEIAGSGSATMVREWKGDDLDPIDRIAVDFGNPALRAPGGRMEIGKELFAAKAINGDQYLQMLATGRSDPMSQRPEMHAGLIASENELLRVPKLDPQTKQPLPVKVLKSDRHDLHIGEHLMMLDDPMARLDDGFVQRVGDHVNAHLYWWVYVWQNEPALAVAMGLQQPPPVTAMIPPPVDHPEMPPIKPPMPAAPPPGPDGMPPGGPPPGAPGPMPGPGAGPQQPLPPGMPGAGSPAAQAFAGGMPAPPVMPEMAGKAVAQAAPGMVAQ